MINKHHPLYGKETICHQCNGPAVWVFNGDMVGNYHYCRACQIETGPFAKDSPPPSSTKDENWTVQVSPNGDWVVTPVFTKQQVDTQMEMQDRMDQLLFDFMKPAPKGPTAQYWLEYLDSLDEFTNKADHPV